MNTTTRPVAHPQGGFSEDELLRLQTSIARRADDLWRQDGCRPGCDLEHWLRAEREVWQRLSATHRRQPAFAAV